MISETGKDQTLLEASPPKPIVIADTPAIRADLGCINTDFSRKFDDVGIPANRCVGLVEFFGCNLRFYAIRKLSKGPDNPLVVVEVE